MEPVPTQTAYADSDQIKRDLKPLIIKGALVVAVVAIVATVVALYVWPMPQYRIQKEIAQVVSVVGSDFESNNLDSALAKLDASLAVHANNTNLLIAKATVLAQKGSLEFKEEEYGTQAVVLAQQAIAQSPNSSEAYRVLAYAYEIQEKYAEAHLNYEKAIALDPSNTMALFGNAHAYDLEGRRVEAEQGYRLAIATDATMAQPHSGLGRMYLQKGDTAAAIEEFKLVLELTSAVHTKAEAAASLGRLYLVQKDAASAEQYADMAVELNPAFPFAWYVVGLVEMNKAGNPALSTAERLAALEAGMEANAKALTLYPNQTVAFIQQARTQHLIFKNNSVALTTLEAAEKVLPSDITLSATEKINIQEEIVTLRTLIQSTTN